MDKLNKKELILQTTLKLITEFGFHGTPVSMIAEEANVGAGTIYRYFKSKEILINELYNQIQEDLNEAILSGIPENISIRDEFYYKYKNILNFFVGNPYNARFLEQYLSSPFVDREVIKKNKERYKHYNELVARGIKTKAIKKCNYDAVTIYMWGTIKELSRVHQSEQAKFNNKLIDEIFDIFWQGIKL